MKPRLRTNLSLAVFCAAFFVMASATNHSLTPTGVQRGYMSEIGSGNTPSGVALAHAAGEFRIVVANILWLSVLDHYHHQYMAQGGDWSKNKDILPLINIIITLDPHFTEAYGVGGLILCELHRYHEARQMFSQGIDNNPTTWEMSYDMALLYAWYRKDPQSALPYAVKARSIAQDHFDQHRLDIFVNTLHRDIADQHKAAAATPTKPHSA